MALSDDQQAPIPTSPPEAVTVYPLPPPLVEVAPPPPMGYPTNEGLSYPQAMPAGTQSRGKRDGFWKGCLAGLCCCCVLDVCCC